MTTVPIPPLLCSTPPPMDFGDEEEEDDDIELPPTLTQNYDNCDEFGDFALATDTTESIETYKDTTPASIFTDVPPELREHSVVLDANSNQMQLAPTPEAKELQIDTITNQKQPVETYNLNVSTAHHKSEEEFNEYDTKEIECTESPSKSLASPNENSGNSDTEAREDSTPSSIVEECKNTTETANERSNTYTKELDVEQTTIQNNNYVGVVKIEDIEDDSSDDEHLAGKKELFLPDENSDDFFSIQNVETDEESKSTAEETVEKGDSVAKSQPTVTYIDDDSAFNDFASATEVKNENEFNADFSSFNAEAFSAQTTLDEMPVSTVNESLTTTDDFNDDFDDFQDFNTAPTEPFTSLTKELPVSKCDGNEPVAEITENIIGTQNEQNDEEDDDFGDFSEAKFTPNTCNKTETQYNSNIMSVTSGSVNERLKSILEVMFPVISSNENVDCVVQHIGLNNVVIPLQSVDSAKALEYQWSSSEMRHSLIRSLGIDSRNILFGEKWNPSMPRFAANLSFNPLKPQQAATNAASDSATSAKSETLTSSLSSGDVPAVEFDWNSAGLVNPLDGHKDDVHAREVEAADASQLGSPGGQSHAAIVFDVSASDNNNNGPNDETPNHDTNADINTSTTAPANVGAATAATLQTDVLPNGLGGDTNQIDQHTDVDDGLQMRLDETEPSPRANAMLSAKQVPKGTLGSGVESAIHLGNSNDDINDMCEVLSTTTYAGPFKETHIYTVPRNSDGSAHMPKPKAPTDEPIVVDFDYEIAAAGIIINEAVVSKEYRDVEYNPPDFKMEYGRAPPKSECLQTTLGEERNKVASLSTASVEMDDEFTDFQSVPPPPPAIATTISASSMCSPLGISRTGTPTISDEMILSPAILLPQAINLASSGGGAQPKIEWGSSVASINPEELARIEELFPQPKTTHKVTNGNGNGVVSGSSNSSSSNSPKTTPSHGKPNTTLSISATIAHKEQQSQPNAGGDDDDWSDFVSVSVPMTATAHNQNQVHNNKNNNQLQDLCRRSPAILPRQQHATVSPVSPRRSNDNSVVSASVGNNHNYNHNVDNGTNNDDEWSDFVSGNAAPIIRNTPQFNSGSWQMTSFYHNPLSLYHQQQQRQHQQPNRQVANNVVPNSKSPLKFQRNGNILHNNNINNNNNNNNNYVNNKNNNNMPVAYPSQRAVSQQHQLAQQQQVHVMQDFSTAPPYQHQHQRAHMAAMAAAAATAATAAAATPPTLPFQVGSAKVAPSVSLIPDLGFMAPAMPTHTAFINALPGFGGSNSSNHIARTIAKK